MHSAIGLGLEPFDEVQNLGSLIRKILIFYFYRHRSLPNTTYSSHFQINPYMFPICLMPATHPDQITFHSFTALVIKANASYILIL